MSAVFMSMTITGCREEKISAIAVSDACFNTVAKTDAGYYFLDYMKEGGRLRINYLSSDGTQAVALCSKSGCTHKCEVMGCTHDGQSDCGVKNCNAHITDYNCYDTGITAYDGSLYFIMSTSDGVGLYTLSGDGAKRKLVGIIDKNSGLDIAKCTLNKGYMYYEVRENKNGVTDDKLFMVNLNNMEEKKLIFEKMGENVRGINFLRGYDEGVYFTFVCTREDWSIDNEEIKIDYELYKVTQNSSEKVLDRKDTMEFSLIDGWLYYYSLDDAALYRMDIDTGVTQMVYRTEKNMLYTIWSDSTYIYLDNEPTVRYRNYNEKYNWTVSVLKKDGIFVRDIYMPVQYGRIVGSDDRYFIINNRYTQTYLYDKNLVENHSGEDEVTAINVSSKIDKMR